MTRDAHDPELYRILDAVGNETLLVTEALDELKQKFIIIPRWTVSNR